MHFARRCVDDPLGRLLLLALPLLLLALLPRRLLLPPLQLLFGSCSRPRSTSGCSSGEEDGAALQWRSLLHSG